MKKLFVGIFEAGPWQKKQLEKLHRGKDDDSIGYRLELYRISLEFLSVEMANHIGVSQGSYSDLKNNNNLPSCQTIKNIMLLDACDSRWLITGKI